MSASADVGLTAAAVRTELELPARRVAGGARHGQRLNRDQAFMLHNRTPAVDSLVECLAHFADCGPNPRVYKTALDLLRALVVSNGRELRQHDSARSEGEQIAAVADQLAAVLHRSETGGLPVALSIKALAAKLRPALRVLADPSGASAAELVDAGHTLKQTLLRVPRRRLLSPTLAHELGHRPSTLLWEVLADSEKTDAEPVASGLGVKTHEALRESAT